LVSLDKIREGAKGTSNLIPLFVEALEKGATLGEISHALRDIFGVHKENVVI
jgi:methylmalonyl-CoA mutase N-terminal domain/subunit